MKEMADIRFMQRRSDVYKRQLLYKGTAALIQPVSDKRIVEAISFTGEGYHMLLKTVLATAVLFLVTLAVAASAAS